MKTIKKEVTVVKRVNVATLSDLVTVLGAKAFTELVENVFIFSNFTLKEYLKKHLTRIEDIETILQGAFSWMDTEQGTEYWCKCSRKWEAFVLDNDIKGFEFED